MTINLTNFLPENLNTIFVDLNQQQLDNLLFATKKLQNYLATFANQSEAKLQQDLELAFGSNFDREKAIAIINNWKNNNWNDLPNIKILPVDVLNGANGGFSKETGEIYLSERLIRDAVNNNSVQEFIDVFIEEIGHWVDSQINPVDAKGDEGDIFSHLVRGEVLSDSQLQELKSEDDLAVIRIDGKLINIEQALSATLSPSPGTAENPKIFKLPSDPDEAYSNPEFAIRINFSYVNDTGVPVRIYAEAEGLQWTYGSGLYDTDNDPDTNPGFLEGSGSDDQIIGRYTPGEVFDIKLYMVNENQSLRLQEQSIPGHYLFIGDADLEITKSAPPDSVAVDEFFYYEITIDNNGPYDAPNTFSDVSNIIIEETLPKGVEFVWSNYPFETEFLQTGETIVKINVSGVSVDLPSIVTLEVIPRIDSRPSSNSQTDSWTITTITDITPPRWINDININNNQIEQDLNVVNIPCFDLGDLYLELEGEEFEDTDGDGYCDGQGTVYIGHKNGIQRMLRVENADVEIYEDRIVFFGGTVYSLIGNTNIQSGALFDINALNIPTGTTSSSLLDETVSNIAEVQLAGLDISFDSLDINTNSFDLGGEFSLPDAVGNHQVILNSNELLRVSDNRVYFTNGGKINPNFQGNFDLFSAIGIQTAKAELSYDSNKDQLKLQGQYTLDASLIKLDDSALPKFVIDLTGRDNFISIQNGMTDFQGSFSLKDLELPELLKIPEIKIGIKTKNAKVDEITGGLSLKLPVPLPKPIDIPAGVEIGFKVNPFELDDLIFQIPRLPTKIPTPIPPTFISSIKLGIENIAPTNTDPVTAVGGLTMIFGDPISVNIPTVISTLLGIGSDPAPITLDLTGKLSSENFEGIGKLTVVNDNILNLEGNFLWDWNKDIIEATGTLKAVADSFVGTATFKLDESGIPTYTGSGSVTINIPNIPFLPGRGQQLSNSNLQVLYSDDNISSNDYIAAWRTISIPNPGSSSPSQSTTLGWQLYFDGTYQPIFSGKEIPITNSWDVEAGLESLMLTVEWENATDEAVAVRVINEQGAFIEEADFAANNIAIVEQLSGPNTKTVIIGTPNPGVWDIQVVDDTGLGQVDYVAYRDTIAPTIEIIEPAMDVEGGEVSIEYEAFDGDSEATVQLFYDDDNEGFDGVLITSDLIEQDGSDTFVWNTQGVATGEYYIYGMIMDDNNAPVFSYSSGKVLITEEADLNITQTVDNESVDIGEEQTYTVTVTNHGENDAQTVNVAYIFPEDANFVSASTNLSEQLDNSLIFNLGNLANGENITFDITLQASNILGTHVNNAFVTSNTYDPNRSNDTASVLTTVTNNQLLPEIFIDDASMAEGNNDNQNLTFTVFLSRAGEETINIDYATVDDTAIANEDYISTNGTLEFAPGETEKNITVEVMGDTEVEEDETFTINLSNPTGNAIADSQGIGKIVNDDLAGFSFDIDGDGEYLAAVDGLLFYGYLNIRNLPTALRDSLTQQLADNLIAPNSTAIRKTGSEIAEYLESHQDIIDIDGNNQIEAAVDGLLVYGYLNIYGIGVPELVNNLTGQLANNLIPQDSTAIRTTGEQIANYMNKYIS